MPGLIMTTLMPKVSTPDDIAVRLDPHRFESAFFALGEPKPELKNQPQIKIIKIPRRLGSFVMAAQMAWGAYDLIYYPPFRRQRKLFNLLKVIGAKKRTVFPLEATAQQILAVDPALRKEILQVLFTSEARYAIGPNIAKTMEEKFGLTMTVIPLGVDTQAFSFIDRRKHTFTGKNFNLAHHSAAQTNPSYFGSCPAHPARVRPNFHIFGISLGDLSYYSIF